MWTPHSRQSVLLIYIPGGMCGEREGESERLTHRATDGDQRRPDQGRDGHPRFDRVTAVIKEVHLAREVQRKVAQPGPGDCSSSLRQ